MKTFRLFISSTFNDFKNERDVLQTEVFPELSKLCADNRFGFMPIDLRWGVTPGAQYDQKTLDLCLGEVRACTVEPHPDFLILSGDRYGWVPLPYMIGQSEFEEIMKQVSDGDRTLIDQWYKLDLNQIDPAYTLQKRQDEYEVDANWDIVEKRIRNTFQNAVQNSALDEKVKNRYFTSATEFEYEEFFERAESADKSIFLVSRTIANGQDNKIFAPDNKRQDDFRERLTNTIAKQNRIELTAKLVDKDHVDDAYLKEFAQSVKTKLTESIQAEIDRIKPMEAQSESEFHAQHMRELSTSVIGRDTEIKTVLDYIDDKTNKLPFIITGISGIGKSSIMARSIRESLKSDEVRVLYRFCGITEKSSSIKSVMISLLQEIGLNIELPHDSISDILCSINSPTVIYIDALDHLNIHDKLEWLPSVLPDHLKIVLSVLEDEKYPKDSQCYKKLSMEFSEKSFYPISTISDSNYAKEIVETTLRKYNRRLQDHQMDYLIKQYEKVKTPFYLSIACEEVRNWSSEQKKFILSDTQRGIAGEYIKNLFELYHHDEELVKRVFGYIFAARESMTEAQLYEILSNDRELVKRFEHADHKNLGDKLPMAVWARLKSHIDPFLREGEEGKVRFFHREFGLNNKKLYQEFFIENFVTTIYNLIDQGDDNYIDILLNIILVESLNIFDSDITYLPSLLDRNKVYLLKRFAISPNWINLYSKSMLKFLDDPSLLVLNYYFYEFHNTCFEFLYEKTKLFAHLEIYLQTILYIEKVIPKPARSDIKIIAYNKAINFIEHYYNIDPIRWEMIYLPIQVELYWSYLYIDQNDKALEIFYKIEDPIRKMILNKRAYNYVDTYAVLIESFVSDIFHFESIDKRNNISITNTEMRNIALNYQNKLVSTFKILINEKEKEYRKDYFRMSLNLIIFYQENNLYEKAILQCKNNLKIIDRCKIIDDVLLYNKYLNFYKLALLYQLISRKIQIHFNHKAILIIKKLFEIDQEKWYEPYLESLWLLEFGFSMLKSNNSVTLKNKILEYFTCKDKYTDAAIVREKKIIHEEILSASLKVYRINQKKWFLNYIETLDNVAVSYHLHDDIAAASRLYKCAYLISRKNFGRDDDRTKEYFKKYKNTNLRP